MSEVSHGARIVHGGLDKLDVPEFGFVVGLQLVCTKLLVDCPVNRG